MRVATAQFDYAPRQAQELGLQKGITYTIVKAEAGKNWWQLEDASGATGFVPANYLKLEDVPDPAPPAPAAPEPAPQPPPAMLKPAPVAEPADQSVHCPESSTRHETGTTIHEYVKAREDEVSILPGWTVAILEESQDGWVKVSLENGDIGWVPETYIERAPPQAQAQAPLPPRPPRTEAAQPPPAPHEEVVRAIYDLAATNPGDLSFRTGDEFTVLRHEDADWVFVCRRDDPSQEGHVPQSYVEPADDEYDAVGEGPLEDDDQPRRPSAAGLGMPAVGSGNVGSLDYLKDSSWYAGSLSRPESEAKLRTSGQVGSFLVRDSERTPGNYSACVLGGETGVKHFKIEVRDGTYIIGTRTFGSMTELLTFYRTTPIFTTATSQEIYLLQPAT